MYSRPVPSSYFYSTLFKKNDPHIRVLAGFQGPDVINQVAKTALI
jgi:hypothetical protein